METTLTTMDARAVLLTMPSNAVALTILFQTLIRVSTVVGTLRSTPLVRIQRSVTTET